jgi:hypothetical protein
VRWLTSSWRGVSLRIALPVAAASCLPSVTLTELPAACLLRGLTAAEGEDGEEEGEYAAAAKPAAKRRAKAKATAGGEISPDSLPAQLNASLTGGQPRSQRPARCLTRASAL